MQAKLLPSLALILNQCIERKMVDFALEQVVDAQLGEGAVFLCWLLGLVVRVHCFGDMCHPIATQTVQNSIKGRGVSMRVFTIVRLEKAPCLLWQGGGDGHPTASCHPLMVYK